MGKSAHHVRNAEDFVNEIRNLSINQDEIMASFDVVSLFTKIAVELALDVLLHRLELWADISSHTKWSIQDICQGIKGSQCSRQWLSQPKNWGGQNV